MAAAVVVTTSIDSLLASRKIESAAAEKAQNRGRMKRRTCFI
jgi:hypothetical protein